MEDWHNPYRHYLIPEIWAGKLLQQIYFALENNGKVKKTNLDYRGYIQKLGAPITFGNGRKKYIVDKLFPYKILIPLDRIDAWQADVVKTMAITSKAALDAANKLIEKHPLHWKRFALAVVGCHLTSLITPICLQGIVLDLAYYVEEQKQRGGKVIRDASRSN